MPKFHVGSPTGGNHGGKYGMTKDEILEKVRTGTPSHSALNTNEEFEAFKIWRESGGKLSIEESTSKVIKARNLADAKKEKVVNLVKEDGFEGHENACPVCLLNKQDSLLDIMEHSGKFQCRRCGKCWWEESLYYLPSNRKDALDVERYTRGGEEKEMVLRDKLEAFQLARIEKLATDASKVA